VAQTSLGELTLPRPLGFKGPTSKGRKDEKERQGIGEGRGKQRKG